MLSTNTLLNNRYKVLRLFKDGGFSLIYEVIDTKQFNVQNAFGLLPCRAIKLLKVFNFSGSSQQDAEAFFRREIELLKRLNHPQIVRYLGNFDYISDQGVVPCVVLEKVQGTTLEDYLSQQAHIPEVQILDWLGQCADILDYLHNEQHVMHLDIKPSNLMVRPTGELVFIDFGIARPISQTLLAKLVDSGEPPNRRAGTDWYMPPEQGQGKQIGQSDIFALGRTMIQSLANRPPDQIAEDDEGGWIWANIAPHISLELKQLLEDMTHYSIKYRLADVIALKQRVDHIIAIYFADRRHPLVRYLTSAASLVLFSLAIAGLIMGGKFLGLLQPLELYVYDQLVRLRPDTEKPDPRILIIEVTEEDVRRQEQSHQIMNAGSLSNVALEQLLNKIQPYSPTVIGIDIYRHTTPLPLNVGHNIIAGCSISPGKKRDDKFPPPPGFSLNQVGFFDMPQDPDDRIRRQLIAAAGEDHCSPTYAFSYQVAKAYLTTLNISISENRQLQLNGRAIRRLRKHQFFYADVDDAGYQTLLNYRTHRKAAASVRLFDILDDKFDTNQLQAMLSGKIVLIGTTATTFQDEHLSPYGKQPGVILQAHQISSLVSAALDGRREITFLPRIAEFGWVFLLTLLGMLKLKRRKTLKKVALSIVMLMSFFLTLVYVTFVTQAIFLPLISSSLTLIFLVAVGSKAILFSSNTRFKYRRVKGQILNKSIPERLSLASLSLRKITALLQSDQTFK